MFCVPILCRCLVEDVRYSIIKRKCLCDCPVLFYPFTLWFNGYVLLNFRLTSPSQCLDFCHFRHHTNTAKLKICLNEFALKINSVAWMLWDGMSSSMCTSLVIDQLLEYWSRHKNFLYVSDGETTVECVISILSGLFAWKAHNFLRGKQFKCCWCMFFALCLRKIILLKSAFVCFYFIVDWKTTKLPRHRMRLTNACNFSKNKFYVEVFLRFFNPHLLIELPKIYNLEN